jgi:predicted 3-demethylubiquinone-9 3-methyltransferase (glyoxalase superfamily)
MIVLVRRRASPAETKESTMPALTGKITPFLWFDSQAEEAAQFYTSIFKNARINHISRYGKAGHETHGRPAGSVMTVTFELEGQKFVALNGGPHIKFNEAVSFQIICETQDEIDDFWGKLSAGGHEGPCGWLKDKFGLSWQVVPAILPHLLTGADAAKSERAMAALMRMKKFDITALQRAHDGQE